MKNIQMMPISGIIPYENNPRNNRDAVSKVAASLKEFGFRQPIVVDKDMVIVAGHTRLLAAKKLKMKEVPVLVADDLTEEQVRAYRLADNKTAEFAQWDDDLLNIELDAIEDIDMSDFGFDLDIDGLDDIGEDSADIEEDDFPDDVESRCKLGDIWQLGNHRLICGDSTDVGVIDRLMDGAKADLVMTDPPYGINAEKMTMGAGAKEFYRGENGWDSKRPDISAVFGLADNVCIWGGNYFADVLPISNDWLVWHKKNDGRSFSECELAWTNFGCNTRHISHHWGGEKKLHVTMKPLEVIAWAMNQTKEKTKVVVDLFGGSGSTLIACEHTGRVCYMCELSEHYCDVIINRWEQLTGQEAVRISYTEDSADPLPF